MYTDEKAESIDGNRRQRFIVSVSKRLHDMFTYYIAGVPTHPDFGHVKLVVDTLKRTLPHFSYRITAKTEDEYQDWLRTFCHRQRWKFDENPIVWKRASDGRYRLVGGINELFELLVESYGVDTGLDKKTKLLMASDNAERMSLVSLCRTTPRPPGRDPVTVCITGAVYPQTGYLVTELMMMRLDRTRAVVGVAVRLHHSDVNGRDGLIKIKNETMDVAAHGYGTVTVVNNVEEGLLDCDVLIVIGTVKRARNEDDRLWTDRNYTATRRLASALNRHCPPRCKVLLTGMDLLCFNLSVLAEYANSVYLYNVVGVTGHLGMETLPAVSRATAVPISALHCPPVWGFVGSQTYVDVDRVVYGHRRPSAHGDGDKYLRTVLLMRPARGDLADVIDAGETDDNKSVKIDCPLSCLPELRATVKLLTEWFKKDSRMTISAAIFSDGTFGLPFGMFMSQPVCMENDEWKPNYDFPAPDEKILKEIITRVKDIMIKYNLGNRFKMYKKELMLQTSK